MDADAARDALRFASPLEQIDDPRTDRTKRHSLEAIVLIALMAVICGADGWWQVELFGRSKLKWLKTALHLPHGIPSHDSPAPP